MNVDLTDHPLLRTERFRRGVKAGDIIRDRMPSHHMIMLRFLRRAANGTARMNPATDDTLKITKLGENSVRCIYTEKSDDETTIDTMIMNYQQLMGYIYRIFILLGLDDDPFQSVQFFIPGYPTVLIQVSTLRQHLPQIIEIMYSTCWSWPAIGRTVVPTPT